MTISDNFNRFYHALLNEFFDKTRYVSFAEWKDNNGGWGMKFYKNEHYDCVALPKEVPFELDSSLKTIFKHMNTDYPISGDKKVSTIDISDKELCRHIDWVTKILNENGYEFQHDMEKWERVKREAGF